MVYLHTLSSGGCWLLLWTEVTGKKCHSSAQSGVTALLVLLCGVEVAASNGIDVATLWL